MPLRNMRRALPLLLLAACGRAAAPAGGQAGDTTAAAAAPAPVPADSAAVEVLRFNSTIAGFDLAIPHSWGRRYTVSERSEPDDYPRAKHVVEFMYLPDEGGVPPTLLAIADYAAADWASVKGNSRGEEVGRKGDLVYVAVPPAKETALVKGSPDEQRFDAARVTAAQVKSALTLH